MRIALIGYEANIQNRVGSNQYAFELIKAVHQLDKRNQYLIYLASPPLPDLPKERKNWQYRVVGPSRLWNILGLPWALLQQQPKPDVVFNPGHYLPLFSPAPLVISVMDLGYLRFPQHFTKPILLKLKFWTSVSIKRAIHILAISQSTKNDIMKYYGVTSEKITVTYPGCNKERFKDSKIQGSKVNQVKEKYKIKSDYILFLGTLRPNKNIEGLLEAFKKLQNSKTQRLKLVIAGKTGWMYARIFQKVKELGLEGKVVFAGFVAEEDVPGLVAGAEVFILPSFWEGFGIPVVEAMACGTPVVVSNAGSLPEIVGDAGIIVDPYQPADITKGLRRVISNPSLRNTLVKKGLRRVKRFSWGQCAQKTIQVLGKVART